MNRELLKGVAIFVLDLAMELEYQRRHPRKKCIEYASLDFTFDGEGECVVRHHDGRLGEISIDPDEIEVEITYRRKGMTIRTQSDKRLSPRDVMDIIGDFLDYGNLEDEPACEDPPIIQIRESSPPELPVRKWLLQSFVGYAYAGRPESEQGLQFENWIFEIAGINAMEFCEMQSQDLTEISELFFCRVIGQLGYLPQEKFDDNMRAIALVLRQANQLPMQLVPLLDYLYKTEE